MQLHLETFICQFNDKPFLLFEPEVSPSLGFLQGGKIGLPIGKDTKVINSHVHAESNVKAIAKAYPMNSNPEFEILRLAFVSMAELLQKILSGLT